MKFLVISDAHLILKSGLKAAYAPYVKEMDLWMKHVSEITVISPDRIDKPLLSQAFRIQDFRHIGLTRLEFHKFSSILNSIFKIPKQVWILRKEMKKADHIHLRAPGNVALLAGWIQLTLPRKRKTVKYAGNWDPQAKQPWAYRLQKKLFSSKRWSKNTKVMAYGDWPDQTVNVVPFFTATYSQKDRRDFSKKLSQPLQFIFVGTLSNNKNPKLLVELIKQLNKKGIAAEAHFYGDGPLRTELENLNLNLEDSSLLFHGNQPSAIVKEAYEKAHFVFLASQSEGWPKVIAEGMWHGCVPIATPVSCVPWMLGFKSKENYSSSLKGILFSDVKQAAQSIETLLINNEEFERMSRRAQEWSQHYTMEKFELAIKTLLES